MSTVAQPTAPPSTPSDPTRRLTRLAGALYLITFVSIPTLALYEPVRNRTDFVLGAGGGADVRLGAALEVVVALAGIGTAVVLFPVLRRQSQTAALGLVAARLVESTLIIVGVVSLLSVLTLRDSSADPASLVVAGRTLSAMYGWTFLLSQSLAPVACDLLLGYLLLRSALVPRALPLLALAGAPLLLASDIAVFTGAYPNTSALAGLAALPVAAFEFSLGLWLLLKGFRPSAVQALGITAPRP